jgi:hypothetical protein
LQALKLNREREREKEREREREREREIHLKVYYIWGEARLPPPIFLHV